VSELLRPRAQSCERADPSAPIHAAFAIGSLTSSLFFLSLFLAFATGAAVSDFFGLQLGLPRRDLFEQLLGCMIAQACEFLDAQ
jgi:hypothetical protein